MYVKKITLFFNKLGYYIGTSIKRLYNTRKWKVLSMYTLSDLRKNLKIQIDGEPYVIVEAQFVKPGKWNVFTRTRLNKARTNKGE